MESFLQDRPRLESATGLSGTPAVAPGFQPFMRKSAAASETVTAANPNAASTTEPEPKIEVIEREGAVERIVITCTCCRRIELRCE